MRALNIPYRRNVVVLRLTAQRLSQCFGSTGINESYADLFAELVYREKQRRGGHPGIVVDAR